MTMRFVVHLSLFCVAMIVGTILIAGPPIPHRQQRNQLEYLEQHAGEIDVVFIGSSRVRRGIIPREFDRRMAERGHSIRSFNFSSMGMRAHEANVYLRLIMDMRLEGLRWFVMEAGDWDATILAVNRFSERAIFWHEPRETMAVVRSALAIPKPIGTQMSDIVNHLLHMGARESGIGRGAFRFSRLVGADDDSSPYLDNLDRDRGFAAYTEQEYETGLTARNRRSFLGALPRYEESLRHRPTADDPLTAIVKSAHERQRAEIREAGFEPVHVAMPAPPASTKFSPDGPDADFLAFDDAEAYPELFRVDHRFDAQHLNSVGAEVFSELLADEFAARFIEN